MTTKPGATLKLKCREGRVVCCPRSAGSVSGLVQPSVLMAACHVLDVFLTHAVAASNLRFPR